MTPVPCLSVAVALVLLVATAAPPNAGQRPREVWLEAVEGHTPGTWDAAAESISGWSTGQLMAALRDMLRVSRRLPHVHETLARAAMLHADIAMHAPEGYVRPGTPYSGLPGRGVLLDSDGRYAGAGVESPDWAFARAVLDELPPSPDAHPFVRTWYRATLFWMAQASQLAPAVDHVERGLEIFPGDPHLLTVRGWINETFASPTTQAMIVSLRDAQPPGGRPSTRRQADVPPVAVALERAEADYTAALAADPARTEVRIHRARIVLLRGRPADAVSDLRQALDEAREPFLVYLASVFLGGALDALGDDAGAAEAYRRATALFPFAQAAWFGMSRTALARGDRAAALAAVRAVTTVSRDHPLRGDPWWPYQLGPGRHADVLLSELHAAVPR